MGNRSTLQMVALVFGAIYLAAGVLGFLPFAGGSSTLTNSALLGLFKINLLHNLVHVVIGIAGLAAAGSLANARTFCQIVGVILRASAFSRRPAIAGGRSPVAFISCRRSSGWPDCG